MKYNPEGLNRYTSSLFITRLQDKIKGHHKEKSPTNDSRNTTKAQKMGCSIIRTYPRNLYKIHRTTMESSPPILGLERPLTELGEIITDQVTTKLNLTS